MVDPNRKINLADNEDSNSDLNDEHIALIKEYEMEFKHRFTDEDKEFMEFCSKPAKPPPQLTPYPLYNNYNNDNKYHNRKRTYNQRDNREPFEERRYKRSNNSDQ